MNETIATPPPERAPPRVTIGDDTLMTIDIKRKHVRLIKLLAGPVIGLVFGSGGLAVWKSINAEDAVSETNEVAGKAAVVAQKTDDKADTSYDVWLLRDKQRETDLAIVVKAQNDLRSSFKELRQQCAPRRRARPEPPPVVLPPKAPPPPTAEAAAAAAPGGTP
jgi:hypothetical protein